MKTTKEQLEKREEFNKKVQEVYPNWQYPKNENGLIIGLSCKTHSIPFDKLKLEKALQEL